MANVEHRKSQPPKRRKDESQERQKRMIAEHFHQLARASQTGASASYTFVPGNLTELLRTASTCCRSCPEINALQSGMRGKSRDYIALAEKLGHSEDVCTYVKCDVGMLRSGNVGPTGERLPSARPAAALVHRLLHVPEVVRAPRAGVQVPGRDAARALPGRRSHHRLDAPVRRRPAEAQGHPRARTTHGRATTRTSCGAPGALGAAEDDLVWVLESAKHRRRRSTRTSAASTTSDRSSRAFRGTEAAIEYYRELRAEVEERMRRSARAPSRPTASSKQEKYRVVVEGPPNWTSFREFWKMFATRARWSSRPPTRRSAASTTTASGTTRPGRSRRSPSTAWAATRTSTCRRASTCSRATSSEYEADGFLINSVKSCNSFSAGQLMILREVEKRTGTPGGFIESDLVDPRYFSARTSRTASSRTSR
jgi:benzoyl-CoA reductase subunit B